MTRGELIDILITRLSHLSPKLVEEAVKMLFERMISALVEGERIEIRGFGSFESRLHKARRARNPRTGAEVTTAEKRAPHFRPGKALRERVLESTQPIHD